MIKRNLVLVLGAGASMPYGFPSGRELVARALNKSVRSFLGEMGFHPSEVKEFQTAMKFSDPPSVDAFLALRSELMKVGKAAIACVLVQCESPDNLFQPAAGRWYPYLRRQLETSLELFRYNKASVVTFNYDRSLAGC